MSALLLAALLAIQPAPVPPAAAPGPAAAPAHVPATVSVVLDTDSGPITLVLETERAPITTANFLRYVDAHRYDGIAFYRAVKVGPGYGLVQGGIRDDARKLFPPIALEPTGKTGLHHTDGAISMAREGPNTAQADFFIVVGDLTSLDADPSKPGDNQGFAVFGHVASGMDVVRAALDAPRSATTPRPDMAGQILATPIRIRDAHRLP